jgi:hypothetical protein
MQMLKDVFHMQIYPLLHNALRISRTVILMIIGYYGDLQNGSVMLCCAIVA